MCSWGLGRAGIFMTEGVFGPWNGPKFTRKTTGEMMLVLCCSAHPLLPRVMESRPPLGIFLGDSAMPASFLLGRGLECSSGFHGAVAERMSPSAQATLPL